MSTLHSMKKNMIKNSLTFVPDMYTNLLGSLVISAYIFSEGKYDAKAINKRWRKLVKNPDHVDVWLDDPDFIDKVLALFDMERPENFPIAMVQSEWNALFMPYVDGKLYPLREDGVTPRTASKGKIYPINFDGTNNSDEIVAKKEE